VRQGEHDRHPELAKVGRGVHAKIDGCDLAAGCANALY
jgi:hypothetical protein